MLKGLAMLVMILALTQPETQSQQKHSNGDGTAQHSETDKRGTNDLPVVETHPQKSSEETAEEAQRDAEQKRANSWNIGLTFAIAICAFLQFCGIAAQVRVYCRQSELMRLALAESKKSTDAALASAKAAVASVRPLLIVVIEKDPHDSAKWVVRAINKGKSAAVLWGANCCFGAHPAEGFEPSDLLKCPIWLPPDNVIIPDADFPVMSEIAPFKNRPSPEDLLAHITPALYYVYGCIQYQDMFSDRNAPGAKPYETRWQFHFADGKFCRSAGPYPRNT